LHGAVHREKSFRMKKIFWLLLLAGSTTFAQTPDWSSKIAAIVYSNCSSCHHEEGIGPFSLMSYEDAVANAFSMQTAVNARKMPPWPPDPNYRHFVNEKILADADLAALNDWINGGMPSGDLSQAPVPPIFNGASLMMNIDQVVNLPAYIVQQVNDEYRTFVIHSGNTQSKFLNSLEFIPGNSSIVHHILLYQDTSNISYQKDLDDPLPGYASNGTTTASPYAVLVGGWAPGGSVYKLPDNMGFEVPAGSDYVVEIHYAPGSMGQTDSTKINMKFTTFTPVRPVYVFPLLYHFPPSLINWPLNIPANQVKTFNEHSGTFSENLSLLSVAPHMHLIGKSFKVFMVTNPGDTTNLIYIPDWNFHWQEDYTFQQLIKFPQGAQIYAQAVYDNTTNNPWNPSNPPITVSVGESTLDEMMVCFFAFLDYQSGDENVILDSTLLSSVQTPGGNFPISVFPNPANNQLFIQATLPDHNVRLRLSDELGHLVKEIVETNIAAGAYSKSIDISDLVPGIYLLEINSGDERAIKKVIRLQE
jgi:hypothetical protein